MKKIVLVVSLLMFGFLIPVESVEAGCYRVRVIRKVKVVYRYRYRDRPTIVNVTLPPPCYYPTAVATPVASYPSGTPGY